MEIWMQSAACFFVGSSSSERPSSRQDTTVARRVQSVDTAEVRSAPTVLITSSAVTGRFGDRRRSELEQRTRGEARIRERFRVSRIGGGIWTDGGFCPPNCPAQSGAQDWVKMGRALPPPILETLR